MEKTGTTDRLVGHVIDGRFRLDGLLGAGGMGRVYAGTQLSVERQVAIKVLREEISDSAMVEERFFREAKLAASIRHPNVVSLIDFGRDDELDALYMVMEYVDGRSLAALVGRGRLKLPLALHVARQICSGLSEAHAAGIVHRDLKPDNVMLQMTAEGAVTARLLDFGIALPSGRDTRFTATGAVVGTPHYMAPEQAKDQPVDGRADLHALGVMFYEMLTGQLPWVAETPMAVLLKVVTVAPPPLEDVLPPDALPPEPVRELLRSLLAKEPADRPQSAAEAGRRFEQIAFDLGASLGSMPSLDALSDAEVIVRESDEMLFGGTADLPRSATPMIAGGTAPGSVANLPTPGGNVPGYEGSLPRPATPPVARGTAPGSPLVWIALVLVLVLGVVAGGALVAVLIRRPAPPRIVEHTGAHAISGPVARASAPVKPVPSKPPVVTEPVVAAPPDAGAPAAPAVPAAKAAPTKPTPPHAKPRPKKHTAPAAPKTPSPAPSVVPSSRTTPPTDEAYLKTAILLQGGTCAGNDECNYAPTAIAAVCQANAKCRFDCEKGNCPEKCDANGKCTFGCSGGKCRQLCAGNAHCSLSCKGGHCLQFCSNNAKCKIKCEGGNCDTRKFDNAQIQ